LPNLNVYEAVEQINEIIDNVPVKHMLILEEAITQKLEIQDPEDAYNEGFNACRTFIEEGLPDVLCLITQALPILKDYSKRLLIIMTKCLDYI
jgi:hypothetical protein